jgi:hypothetical protein
MSTRFASAEHYADIAQIRDAYPGATEIMEIEGGWLVFATEDDFATWSRQR